MPRYTLGEFSPQVDASAFVAPSADLIGRVSVGDQASVWFGAVLRGDLEAVTVGERSNVQDGAVLHTDPGFPCTLGREVTVGHRAIVHGASCEDGSLVGMGAVMLNGSRLGQGAVLGAGALLAEGREVPDGMLALGVPAKVVRPVEAADNAGRYVQNASRYRAELRPAAPEVQPGDTP
ncbi:gamma carbonic anhydrase family protein [Deinococcus irradiatisoli]|uniref:Gamma carbonic anhydrase family protein n=1 Tax=Deinococcus irradiatisoli TaxID=2202254 RepID=A0A2Z3JSG9_9DEIO|nr:gamma carbonic anhydrase family protein [Deinococcus irradiatisoli]AWN23664.1 gamma carbonic anhydrase family protein [Deinococcus irradiatisoli]